MVRSLSGRRYQKRIAVTHSALNPILEKELDWYFTEADSASNLPSNFEFIGERALSGRTGYATPADLGADDRADANHAASVIQQRLRAMPNHAAGVLLVAFEPRPWPEELELELGLLTGIVVRLAAAKASPTKSLADLRKDEASTATLLNRTLVEDGPLAMGLLRAEAQTLFTLAMRAYARVRGLGPSVVPGRK